MLQICAITVQRTAILSNLFYFLQPKKFFERKIFNSVVGVFLAFPDLDNDAQTYARILQSRTVGVLNITYVCVSPRLESQRRRARIPLPALFLTYFYILINARLFFITKKQTFVDKFQSFSTSGLYFSRKSPIFRRN